MSSARDLAAQVLVRVWRDMAFAAAALDAEIGRAPGLDPRDASLATELVYGVLRVEGYLERSLTRHATRGRLYSAAEAPLARAHLLMGAYSLAFLDRVPAFAAVSEAVAGVRAVFGEGPSKFANALLRSTVRELESSGRPRLEDAIVESTPAWLRKSIEASVGEGSAKAYLAAGPVPPPLGLACARGVTRDDVRDALRAVMPEGATLETGPLSPRALLLRGAGDPRKLPGVEDTFIVQEEGAQVVALALGARPGDRVLDACAGRGNKAWLLSREVGAGGYVGAADKLPAKLEALAARAPGPARLETFAVDWTVGAGNVPAGFDRVLVDAPCSGVGTLRRRPEIARHRSRSDVRELAATQEAVLRAAADRAKSGGIVVYAVCSVLRAEAEAVVDAVVAVPPVGTRLSSAPFDAPELGALLEGRTSIRLLPNEHGTDGYFIASLRVDR